MAEPTSASPTTTDLPPLTTSQTATFSRSALHQPVSNPGTRRTSLASRTLDPDDNSRSPAALPLMPPNPGFVANMNVPSPVNGKPPSPVNPSNSTQQPVLQARKSIQSIRKRMQEQALANSGITTPSANGNGNGAGAGARKSRTGGQAVDSEWNPKHPCFPHPNVHVPITSPLFDATRIIRIPRDWMEAGDLYPVFSSTYPEILLPHISEQAFRALIQRVNSTLKAAYKPATATAVMDGVLGALSGWVLEDAGLVGPKRRIKAVEAVIEGFNNERLNERNDGKRYGPDAETDDSVMVVPLRRTAYMSLDIQIPDPKLNFEEGASQGSAANSAISTRRPSVAAL